MTPSISVLLLKTQLDTKHYNSVHFNIYLSSLLISTLYVMVWDFYLDWGLFRGTKPGKKLLRDQLVFSDSFYYLCMIQNVLIRFFWVVPLISYKTLKGAELTNKLQIITFLAMILEGYRRTFWAIIRVENESFNNFE